MLCALACASLSQLGRACTHLNLFHALATVKFLQPVVNVFKRNTIVGIVPMRSGDTYAGYIAACRGYAAKLSSLIFSITSLFLLLK